MGGGHGVDSTGRPQNWPGRLERPRPCWRTSMSDNDDSADKSGTHEADRVIEEPYVAEAKIEIPTEAWEHACERWHYAKEHGREDADLMDYVQSAIVLDSTYTIMADVDGDLLDEDNRLAASPPANEWEQAGRQMLAWIHAQIRDDVVTALDQLAMRANEDEPISKTDVEYLRQALQQAEFFAQQAATVCPEVEVEN